MPNKQTACEAIAAVRVYIRTEDMVLREKKIESLLDDIQKAVNRLVSAYAEKYEVGSHIRCPLCEWNGGIVIQRICKHCGKVEIV